VNDVQYFPGSHLGGNNMCTCPTENEILTNKHQNVFFRRYYAAMWTERDFSCLHISRIFN